MADRIIRAPGPDRVIRAPGRNTVVVTPGKDRIIVGARGLPGRPGPVGPPGGSAFEHSQSTPSAEWVVNHNLGFRPGATVLSPGGVEVSASVIHASNNQLRVFFAQPQTGSVHCV